MTTLLGSIQFVREALLHSKWYQIYMLWLWNSRNDFVVWLKGSHATWSYIGHVCACFNLHQLLFQLINALMLGPTQPPIQEVPGAISLGIKRPGLEADHSSPSSTEVNNAWSYTSTPPIRLHGVVVSYKKAQVQLYLNLFRFLNGWRKRERLWSEWYQTFP
jgi:hypothetical protein